MAIVDKFFKEMFLKRLPTSVQTILASGSDDLDISKLAEMADRMIEVEPLSSTTVTRVSQPLTASTSDLAKLKAQIAQLSATVATLQLRLREISHLDYISQFTSEICQINGSRNEVVDALSRPSIAHLQLSHGIDLAKMAAKQRRICSHYDEDVPVLQLQELPLTNGNGTILCDVSTPSHRPFVPLSLRRKVSSTLHNLPHPGSRAADRLVPDRFV
ncbi:hypothetical protein SprV_0200667000 [Sparganum proliferum]